MMNLYHLVKAEIAFSSASFEAAERERSASLSYVETVSTDVAIDTDAMNEELLQIQLEE
jgi:hypothetical protein